MEAAITILPTKARKLDSGSADLFAKLERWRQRLKFVERISPSLAARVALEIFLAPRRHERPAREHKLLNNATRLHLGSGLAAWAWGSGRTVLLVHGWEGRGAQLGAFVEPLTEAGFRVVTFDGPAHGDSFGRTTTLSGFADAILKIRWLEGDVHAVIAHSFGSAATTLALHRGLGARGAVFVAPVARIDGGFKEFARVMQLEASTIARMQQQLEKRAGRRLEDAHPSALAPEMTIPLAIFHDRNDREVNYQDSLELSRLWPDAAVHLSSGLNHHRILRDADVVKNAVEFIKSLDDVQPELERRMNLDALENVG